MRSLAVVVARTEGEATRRALAEEGLLRRDLRIRATEEEVAFPVSAAPTPDGRLGRLEERDFEPVAEAGPASYRDLVDLPEPLRGLLPRAFDVVGGIVLIRLPESLEPYGAAIGAALLEFVPGARLVGQDRGVRGIERRRDLARLSGSGPWTTRHTENGLTFDVDLEGAYFSPRLAREHALVAAEVRAGERVYDLCCGIAPFALTIARDARAREVVAVDLNPAAVLLARANAQRLGLAGRVTVIEAPIASFLGSAGPADRVVFNLPRDGIKYALPVSGVVGPGGTLHYYEVTDSEVVPRRPQELVSMLETPTARWSCPESHRVHAFAPGEDLMAYALRRSP